MTMVGGLSCHTSLQKSVTDLGMGPARAGEWDMSGVGWCMAKAGRLRDGGSLCFAPAYVPEEVQTHSHKIMSFFVLTPIQKRAH